VEKRRPITEEDVLLTELLIARSYGNLKQSVVRASSGAFGSTGATIRKHPYAAAGAAIGAGIILFGLFRLISRGGSGRRSRAGDREYSSRPDMAMEILSMIMPIITPYITAYAEKYLGRMFSRNRD
jgi:hypothetical protein